MIHVYHKIKPDFFSIEFKDLSEYKKVAEVDTDDLEKAFHLTNHISTDWTTNEDVEAVCERNRSSSVGDVMYDAENKKWYMVDVVGFKLVKEQ